MYVVGRAIVNGLNVYTVPDLAAVYTDMEGSDTFTPWGVFYTPSAGLALLPLTFLPLKAASAVWFAVSSLILSAGVLQLIGMTAPRLPLGYRVLVVGGLMCAAATRWASSTSGPRRSPSARCVCISRPYSGTGAGWPCRWVGLSCA
jgi:hypothetical protein